MDSFIFEDDDDDEDYGDNDEIQQMNVMLWRIVNDQRNLYKVCEMDINYGGRWL